MKPLQLIIILIAIAVCLPEPLLAAAPPATQPSTIAGAVDPLKLIFRRKSVRRFVFNNNIQLTRLDPPSVVSLDLMHNITPVPAGGLAAEYAVRDGLLAISNARAEAVESVINVGGINPFATFDVSIDSITPVGKPLEIGIDLSPLDQSERLVIAAIHPADKDSVVLRVHKDGKVTEKVLLSGPAPQAPYILRAQLGGFGAAVYIVKNDNTTLIANLEFPGRADFRVRKTIAATKFNIVTKLPPAAAVTIRRAESYLSAGAGQADIRMITHKDGAPFIENNRLWFTFSARGFAINQSCQGVMSLDPSTFEPRFEGIILSDFGDGVLYNSYSSHVFYDDDAKEWKAWNCDFGGTPGNPGRSGSHLGLARSKHDPRRGVSVLSAKPLKDMEGTHEDPCGFYDAEAGKWRLLVSTFMTRNIRASIFEADAFDGPYRKIAGPVEEDSTGTLIQKIGDKRYVFSGSASSNIWVYSYPDLKRLGPLQMDLPPWNKTVKNARVWPNVFPLPAGFPARYMAMMMDRANYPNAKGPNWSYGALYLYEADTDDISDATWEFLGEPGRKKEEGKR